MQRLDARIQPHRPGRKFRGNLCGNRSHAPCGDARVSLREHLEDELKHAARGFEFPVKKYPAEKWPEEAMDHLRRESFGLQGLFGGTLRPAEDLFRRGPLQAAAQTRDA